MPGKSPASAPHRMDTRPHARLLPVIGLWLIVALGAFLRLYQLGAFDIGNAYYAATVKSMLASWHNFFYASFEPGGSVTVDKPPMGFWVQAASAYLLGVNGFALALPNALAGVLAIPLLYSLVRRQFGVGAGLVAALGLAVTPVAVSTERNNTIDGLLVFVLLLAAWAVWRSVRGGKLRYLLLGVLLVGLGFNIKMLQAYMILPALYLLYLFGAPHTWWKRLAHLGAASVLLVVVSLSWAVVVDLTPPEERPYIGSSSNNTVMELIIGHNGLSRLGLRGLLAARGNRPAAPDGRPLSQSPAPPGNLPLPPNNGAPGSGGQAPPGQPPQDQSVGPQNSPGGGQGNRQPFNREVGQAGWRRLFTEPLVTEAGWLLPLALLGIPLVIPWLNWRWPLGEKHLGLLLWAGWLLPEMAYFSFTTGLFHAYYLVMLGPPLAAMVGLSVWALWRTLERWPWAGWVLVIPISGALLAFQIYTLGRYPQTIVAIATVSIAAWVAGTGLLAVRARPRLRATALALVIASLSVAPLAWSAQTTFNKNPNVWLPKSGAAAANDDRPTILTSQQQIVLDYLLANSDPDGYLMAANAATTAAPYILESGRAVFTFGGFNGRDQVIGVDELAYMIAQGEIRFVLGSGNLGEQKPGFANWLERSCTIVKLPGLAPQASGGPERNVGVLYDCAGPQAGRQAR